MLSSKGPLHKSSYLLQKLETPGSPGNFTFGYPIARRLKLRIDNCDERLYYKEGDISGLKGAIFINDISIENPDLSLLHDMI